MIVTLPGHYAFSADSFVAARVIESASRAGYEKYGAAIICLRNTELYVPCDSAATAVKLFDHVCNQVAIHLDPGADAESP